MPPLPRKTCKEDVKEYLMRKIFAGKFRPGDRITEIGLATELGVSQAVVREAFADLRARNILERVPYKETRIRGYDREEVADAIRARNELEEIAFRWVLEKEQDLSSLVGDLETIREEMLRCLSAKDWYGFREKDVAFHRRIFAESGSLTLTSFWDMLGDAGWVHFGVYRGHLFNEETEIMDEEAVCEAYVEIIEAVRRRDLEGFVALIRRWKLLLE